MRGAQLSELSIFLVVAEQKSFRKAAMIYELAPSAISHAIRSLEERIGVRLFHRSTRSVSLTNAGKIFFDELQPAFHKINQSLDNINLYRDTPIGIIKINIPNSIAPFILKTIMIPLMVENPELQLDIAATDRLVNIVEEGFDAGIRFSESLDLDMIAVPIKSQLRFAVVGSPNYFEQRSLPKTPQDLHEHTCIRYRYAKGNIFNWEFEQDGKIIVIKIDSSFTLDTQELMVDSALQGYGLAYVWEGRVETYLQNGTLIRCLEDWCGVANNLYLYYSSRHHLSAGLRALIDMIKLKK